MHAVIQRFQTFKIKKTFKQGLKNNVSFIYE